MAANLFMPVQFKSSVQLKPNEMDADYEQHLLYKLQQEYEGKCSRHGFIKPNSLTVVQRSMGRLMKPHFNGHIRFEVMVVGEVCNPVEGMVVSAEVKNKNVLGILAESSIRVNGTLIPVLDIIIPKRTAGISSEIALDALNIGDVIQVEILGKRFQLHDQRISIIGRGVESAESVQQRRQKIARQAEGVEGLDVAIPEDDAMEGGVYSDEEQEGGDASDDDSVDGDSDIAKTVKKSVFMTAGDGEDDAIPSKPFDDGDEFEDEEVIGSDGDGDGDGDDICEDDEY